MSSPNIQRSLAARNELRAAAQLARERFPELSPREAKALVLLAEGLEHSAIAARPGIGVRTAERHVARVRAKLGVENRGAAVARSHHPAPAPPAPVPPRRPPAP
jgi:DNA-binding NarL/FixJ family response regulator